MHRVEHAPYLWNVVGPSHLKQRLVEASRAIHSGSVRRERAPSQCWYFKQVKERSESQKGEEKCYLKSKIEKAIA